MKIGVDIRVLMDKHYSGISEYTANLLEAMLRLDQDDEWRLFYNSWNDISGRLATWHRNNSTLQASRWPNKIFNYVLQKTWNYPKLDKLLGGVDIFWSPHFNFTSLSSQPLGPQKVITVHDLSFLRYPKYFSARKNFWHRSLGVVKTIQKAEAIVAVSENTKQDIIELSGILAERIKVIYSGNNVTGVKVSDEICQRVKKKFGISGRFILYVGNIEPRKNIAGLIAAFNIIKSAGGAPDKSLELVLAGASGWKNREIYAAWEKSPFKDSIKFIGYIDHTEKEVLYSSADIFVYPSFYEGFGFPPLEAMAFGLPVVCSNVSSLPEVVGEAAVLINPYQPEEIAYGILEIWRDNKLRQDLITKGRERARQFSWDKAATEYLELFRNIQK